MATECTQEVILDFLTERGGRVKNVDLIDYFKPMFPEDPETKATMKKKFKRLVDNVAFVRVDSGVKFVCLKKRYRGLAECGEIGGVCVGNGASEAGRGPILEGHIIPSAVQNSRSSNSQETTAVNGEALDALQPCVGDGHTCEASAARPDAQPEISPGSGCGSASEVSAQQVSPTTILSTRNDGESHNLAFAQTVEEIAKSTSEIGMGNSGSSRCGGEPNDLCVQTTPEPAPDIPRIAVIEASPLPAAADGSMFDLPGYQGRSVQSGPTGQVDTCTGLNPKAGSYERGGDFVLDELSEPQLSNKANQSSDDAVTRCRNSMRVHQPSLPSGHLQDDGIDETHLDLHSLSESEGSSTPRSSRKNFIEVMMNSSPQVRRSMVLRNSLYLSARNRDLARSDSDSASVASSNPDEDGTPITLDPLEHEWMMCTSDGEWDSLRRLLACEPSLILKKDFVTGFTCLHWAAKQGKPELLALIVNFAKRHTLPININTRSSAGYTPLHLAAMHNHMEVVKLLVGAYDADVELRDYSGKKACQYLTNSVGVDIRDIVGAYENSASENTDNEDKGRWRFSKVLHSNLRPLKLLPHSEDDSVDGEVRLRQKPVRRMSSLSKMGPKLQKIRFRTSQLVHSSSFHGTEETERSWRGSFKSRPKSNFFG
ncbi:ankyrin repeat domain-containing protein SOWAHC-like [Lampris incognitus]|uniref:ankyrin repeat domain-containing protein SOWAHC-like n=1 Tax=Lampris incognitus TaxID=2546036 RepID=UPI0024B4C7C7|nr:ankyrin repeat domain-containing protein SOWAHC-like [Lampris incognitus]